MARCEVESHAVEVSSAGSSVGGPPTSEAASALS